MCRFHGQLGTTEYREDKFPVLSPELHYITKSYLTHIKEKLLFNFVCNLLFREFYFHIISKHKFINNPLLCETFVFSLLLGGLLNFIFKLPYINNTWDFIVIRYSCAQCFFNSSIMFIKHKIAYLFILLLLFWLYFSSLPRNDHLSTYLTWVIQSGPFSLPPTNPHWENVAVGNKNIFFTKGNRSKWNRSKCHMHRPR